VNRGSLLPLAAGLLALTVALTLAVVSATSLTITRHRLVALAESTALAAADSFDPALIRRTGTEATAPLSNDGVRQRAADFLSAHPALPVEAVVLERADTPDGIQARVVLATTWRAPLWSEFVPLSVPLRAESLSRSVIR